MELITSWPFVVSPKTVWLPSRCGVAVCVMKKYKAHRMEETPVREHLSFVVGEERGIGSSSLDDVDLISSNLAEDPEFDELLRDGTVRKVLELKKQPVWFPEKVRVVRPAGYNTLTGEVEPLRLNLGAQKESKGRVKSRG